MATDNKKIVSGAFEAGNSLSDCSKHKKEVAGISDTKILARMIADSHYQWQADLWKGISNCYKEDGIIDSDGGRPLISATLWNAHFKAQHLANQILNAWHLSKKFMEPKK